jgi:hypothetical protein
MAAGTFSPQVNLFICLDDSPELVLRDEKGELRPKCAEITGGL